jgi:hypothetical protein
MRFIAPLFFQSELVRIAVRRRSPESSMSGWSAAQASSSLATVDLALARSFVSCIHLA